MTSQPIEELHLTKFLCIHPEEIITLCIYFDDLGTAELFSKSFSDEKIDWLISQSCRA